MIETITQNVTTSHLQNDVHTQLFCTLSDQEMCAEPPEESALCEDEVWTLHKALYGNRGTPKLWRQHGVTLLESLNYHPLLTDPSCFRSDDLDINMFIHVDDGLLFGPSIDILRLIDFQSNQVMMHIVGRLARLGDRIFFPGRVIVRTARGYSVEANPKHIPRRDCRAWSGELETFRDSKYQENANDKSRWSSWRTRNDPCTGQPWESCCTCARIVQTSRTA